MGEQHVTARMGGDPLGLFETSHLHHGGSTTSFLYLQNMAIMKEASPYTMWSAARRRATSAARPLRSRQGLPFPAAKGHHIVCMALLGRRARAEQTAGRNKTRACGAAPPEDQLRQSSRGAPTKALPVSFSSSPLPTSPSPGSVPSPPSPTRAGGRGACPVKKNLILGKLAIRRRLSNRSHGSALFQGFA